VNRESYQAPTNGSVHIRSSIVQGESEYGERAAEDPGVPRKKRTYHTDIRNARKQLVVRKIGEDRVEKVFLQSVRKWRVQGACVIQCLRAVSETEILDVRYDVWMNCKSCDDRVTWILRQLWTFMEPNAATGWIDFKFRLDGRSVCSACFAHILGYSRRQLDRWKDDIRTRDRKSACHGNVLKPHETNHVVAARAILQQYIRGCGCI
jgi:hypothetical protein